MDGTVLIADDDRTIRTVLTQALTRAGCKVHATSSLTTLMRWVDEGKGELVISDVVMPDGNGLEMLPKIAEERPDLPVIVISAQNTIMTAIQAAEAEAYDYLPKPFDLPDLMKRAAKALEQRKPARQTGETTEDAETQDLPLVGKSAAMQELYRLVARVMNADLPVLVTGESGSGKSLIARAIHDLCDRRTLPFVVAGAEELSDPDKTARLLTEVRGGTLLLDEVADLDDAAQARLVRTLDNLTDTGPRIISTSRVDLDRKTADGDYREDLFYRLAGVPITVPPLRDRVDDIDVLADHFLAQSAAGGGNKRQLSAPALDWMRSFPWPGNVRQLENTVRRLTLTSATDEISKAELEAILGTHTPTAAGNGADYGDQLSQSVARHLRRYFDMHGGALPPPGLYPRILREMEHPLIEIALDATAGNQAKCAELLGLNRNTLRKKITDLDIRVTRRRKLM
ncbi:response regulator [Aliiroseovarius sp. YM-037]|uniref:response regulator n=1 Tax=Aliiroseovarius sp. YM-037 TaxID=3341728 RepID=UPI003A802B7D